MRAYSEFLCHLKFSQNRTVFLVTPFSGRKNIVLEVGIIHVLVQLLVQLLDLIIPIVPWGQLVCTYLSPIKADFR